MMSSTNLHATSPATIQSIPGKIISRRERRTADVRQRLFDAALTLFAERGFLKTTVEDITEAADVGKGTFFNYFPSKEQLLDSFSDTRIEKIRRALATITEKRSTVKDAVKQMYFDLSQDPGRSQELTRSMLLTMLTNQAVWGQVCSRMHESQELMKKIFQIGKRRGEVRDDVPATDLARSFKESYFGALFCWSFLPSAKLSTELQRAFEHFWAGAAARSARPVKKGAGR
jgi:AcrR family transcriptional regulator